MGYRDRGFPQAPAGGHRTHPPTESESNLLFQALKAQARAAEKFNFKSQVTVEPCRLRLRPRLKS